MSEASARGVIVLSAFVVAGVYFWRWVAGPRHESNLAAGSLLGSGPMVSPEGFIVAWGAVYLLLSLLASFAPALAGSLALLILFTDLIANLGAASDTALALEKAKTTQQTKGHHAAQRA